jgi:hypothetical protein
MQPVLSYLQADILLATQQAGKPDAMISPDLGLTTVLVLVKASGVIFPGGEWLDWGAVQEIRADENACYVIEGNGVRRIHFYSELTDQVFSLYPTHGAPTMLISGIPMHRIKDTDPHRDTLEKIRAIRPVVGKVLDTATGLGYTAIEAARTANQVVTIELDPTALQVARLNPWSQALFDNPRITQVIGDSYEVITGLDDASFTRILHDPPVFHLAGDLYSREVYQHLYRLLRNGGKLFHYIGDPDSKSGRSVTGGVIRRLHEAGFRQVMRAPRAFGVVAEK